MSDFNNTYMGVYLKVVDQSQYFTVEPAPSTFPVVSTARLQKGQVGVPIEFTNNNLINILRDVGLPIKGKNDKEWWSFHKAFQYSRPVSVFRVINPSTFKNAGVTFDEGTGDLDSEYKTVDGQTIDITVTGKTVFDTTSYNVLLENDDVSSIKLENEGFASPEIGKIFLKSPGVNPDNISAHVVNQAAIANPSEIMSAYEYDALASGTLNLIDGVIQSAVVDSVGSGYVDGESVTLTGQTSGIDTATATISVTAGEITGFTITDGSSGYTNSETADVIGGSGTGGTATVTTADGVIDSVSITEAGSGYTDTILSYEITTSTGSGADLDIVLTDGSISDITVNDGGTLYDSTDTIKFIVTEDVSVTPYEEYSYIEDLFDFTFTQDKLVLLIYVDDVLQEKFYFDGDSTSDYYWGNIKSNYVYVIFDDDVLTDDSTSGFQETPYAGIYNFQDKGEGTMDDVEFSDYLSTIDYIPNSGINNALFIDGGITSGTKLNGIEISQQEAKQYQIKLINTIGTNDVASVGILTFPQSLERTLIGTFNLTESDLEVYKTYKNSLGLNGESGQSGAIYAPSSQKVFDIFNNQWLWMSIAVDEAGSIASLKDNYHYSNVEAIRGTLGIEKMILDIKTKSLEGYLYKNGINPIVNRDGIYINKGHKTLTTQNTAFNRLNVVRTMNVFKTRAQALASQFVGELGLEETRIEVTDTFNSFIQRFIDAGKIINAKVVCDDTNNDPSDLDNNQLIVDLYVKPVKLYDYVHLTVTVLPQGAEIS